MRMLILPLVLLTLAVPALPAAAPEDGAVQLYDRAQRAYFDLKADESLLGDPESWQRVVKAYRLIIDSYPNDPLVDDIIFITGGVQREIYENFGDRSALEESIASYRTLLRDFPESYLRQAALFAIGEIQENYLNSSQDALATYQDLVRRFPKGYKTAAAKARIETLTGATAAGEAEEAFGSGEPAEEAQPNGSGGGGTMPAAGEQVIINDIRTSFGRNNGRVVIELSRETKFEYKQLPAPNRRIFFDLHGVVLQKSNLKTNEIAISNSYLKRIRLGQFSASTTRVVLDFDSFRRYRIFTLPSPYRIVFDLYGAGDGPSYLSAAKESTSGGTEPTAEGADSNHNGEYSISRQLGAKIKTIVIDPGHGGKDPGAVGIDGLKEKDIVLDVAKRLRALAKKEMPWLDVKLTREDDTFIELEQRPAWANAMEADLFFSIHANASRDRGRGSGISTYFMNFASDKEAEELAAKENAYSQLSQAKLTDLLAKITLNNKKEESKELASFIQTNLYRQTKPVNRYARNRGVRSAPLVVLIGADIPSVLVEISFVDHAVEGKLLLTGDYRDRIARGLLGGIKAYIESLQ